MPYAIYNDNTMVGFIMLSFNEANKTYDKNTYWIWRFMIDKSYQGKGYGREALKKAIDLVKTFPHGHASEIYLSYEPENIEAKRLYESIGFVETGDIDEGELVSKLVLSKCYE